MDLPALEWFPKPNGAGDIDGAGSQRLLGQPELDLVNLVVREAAQNSWDARLPGTTPLFEVRLRDLDERHLDILRWNVFSQTAPDSRLGYCLGKGDVAAIEICDRNTRGLAGTLRNDLETQGDKDWADFVLAVGAPPDNQQGGGTYGFGKTASYSASRSSTILIWSVTQTDEGLQHRFIASAMDRGFAVDGQRFTGRQWWGRIVEETGRFPRIEPVLGDLAQRFGEALFERHFAEGETGTSLLILDPWPAEAEDPEMLDGLKPTWASALPGAVVRNLWPKLVPGQPADRSMEIRIFDHGQEIPLRLESSPTIRSLGQCLSAVRSGDNSSTADPYLQFFPLRISRPVADLGHLALTRYLAKSDDPYGDLAGRVAFMRTPELVVRSQEYGEKPDGVLNWVGVFKPLDHISEAFAHAEPPAHDLWEPKSVRDKTHRRYVNVALREIKENTLKRFLAPAKVTANAVTASSTAKVSTALAGLAGTALGARPTGITTKRPTSTRRTGTGTPRPSTVEMTTVELLNRSPLDLEEGRERSRFHFTVQGAAPLTVELARVAIVIDGRTVDAGDDVEIIGWSDGTTAPTAAFPTSISGWLEIAYPEGVAIDLSLRIKEA